MEWKNIEFINFKRKKQQRIYRKIVVSNLISPVHRTKIYNMELVDKMLQINPSLSVKWWVRKWRCNVFNTE